MIAMDAPHRSYVPALRRETLCAHLISDNPAELHKWAAKLGLRRSYFQAGRNPHYDLMGRVVAQAKRLGVPLCDRATMLRLAAECRDALAAGGGEA